MPQMVASRCHAEPDESISAVLSARVVHHAKCDKELASRYKQCIWLEISWLLFSPFGISHLQQQQIVFITVLYIPKSALFSTLQLYGIYSTLFLFDPPTQNTLYIYIYH